MDKKEDLINRFKLGLIVLACAIPFLIVKDCHGQAQINMTYAQTQNTDFTQVISNTTDLTSYQAKDGTIFKVGDKLSFGKTSSNNNFACLYLGRYTIGNALLTGPPTQLNARYQKDEVIIDRIFVNHTKMSRKSPLYVIMFVLAPNSTGNKARTIMDYEKAVDLGEVINPRAPMSREQAIAKLKESKDLLDLGVITQVKYDSIKSTLTPIITQQ